MNDDDIEMEELIKNLPQVRNWRGDRLCLYNNFWTMVRLVQPTLNSQKYFKAHNKDIISATLPKSGTTWLQALIYSIVNRNNYSINQTPLLTNNSHDLVPRLEFLTLNKNNNHVQDLKNIAENSNFGPRIFTTHVPYHLLSNSIHESECKIIYLCRNPLDHFISLRSFLLKNELESDGEPPLSFDECFDMFCRGISLYGPFWEHVLGYWNAYLKKPDKILFLTYEDLKEDVVLNVMKIADFIGFGFSKEEETGGVIEEIVKLCSFENMKDLEVNKTGIFIGASSKEFEFKNSSFFKKGQVGDWANHLTPEMAERFHKIIEVKLQGSGLNFKYSAKD